MSPGKSASVISKTPVVGGFCRRVDDGSCVVARHHALPFSIQFVKSGARRRMVGMRRISDMISQMIDGDNGLAAWGSRSSVPRMVATPLVVRSEILPRLIQWRTNTRRTAQLVSRSSRRLMRGHLIIADQAFDFFVKSVECEWFVENVGGATQELVGP